jgi:hypothetical protein
VEQTGIIKELIVIEECRFAKCIRQIIAIVVLGPVIRCCTGLLLFKATSPSLKYIENPSFLRLCERS